MLPIAQIQCLINISRLRKIRSQLLSNAVACGNPAIVLLRPAILPKSIAAKNAGAMPPSSNGSDDVPNPRGKRIKNTVEQFSDAKSVPINNDDDGAESKKNNFVFSSLLPFCPYPPRATQNRQKRGVQKNLLANVRAATSRGKSIQERLTKNSVVPYATTSYAQPRRVLNVTTSHVDRSGKSLLSIV